MTDIDYIDIEDIEVGPRLRQVNQAKVDVLAESMGRIGQQVPITLWLEYNTDDVTDGYYHLVAGLHRIEAAKKLGWDSIDYIETVLDEIDREIWQIDENLCRAELDKAEEAQHYQRRKELFEAQRTRDMALGAEVAQLYEDLKGTAISEADRAVKTRRREEIKVTGPRARIKKSAEIRGQALGGKTFPTKPQHEKGFAAETAEKTGLTKRKINQALRRAECIAPAVFDEIKGTAIANSGVELDALMRARDEQMQMDAVKMVKAGKVATVREAIDNLRDTFSRSLETPAAPAPRKPNPDNASGLEAIGRRNAASMGVNLDELAANSRVTTDPASELMTGDAEPSETNPAELNIELLMNLKTAWLGADENVRREFGAWLKGRGELPVRSRRLKSTEAMVAT